MVSVVVSMMPTGVPIGGKHTFKHTVVRHLAVQVHGYAEITTACGYRLEALPRTWQPDRMCERCAKKMVLQARSMTVEIGAPEFGMAYFHDEWEARLQAHGRRMIRHCGSKKYARIIAVGIGYAEPEDILEDHPDLHDFIVYIRPPK